MRKGSWTNTFKGIAMESLFKELEKNLLKQEANLKLLLNIAREHNRALRQLSAGSLPEIIGREEAVTVNIGRCEKDRKKITDSLAERLGLEKDAVLSEFTARAPRDARSALADLLERMKALTGELTGVNSSNGDLTKQAMRFNTMILKIFSPAGKNVYTPEGKRADEGLNISLLDKKV